MPTNAETFSVRLTDDLKQEVDALAKLTKRSRSFIVQEAVASYIASHRDYLNAVDEALAEADKGIFVSGKRAFEWLDSFNRGNPGPLPEPDITPGKAK